MRHGRTRAAQLIAAILVCVSSALAQTSWVRTYGGTDDDYAQSVQQTSNGGYVIGGVTKSFGTGTPRYANVYFMKTNSSGDTLRTRSYGGTGDDYGYSVQQTSDEGYVIAGATTSFGAGQRCLSHQDRRLNRYPVDQNLWRNE